MATVDEILASLKAKLDSDAAAVNAQVSANEATTIQTVSDAIATLVPVGGTMTDAQKAVIAQVISMLQALIA